MPQRRRRRPRPPPRRRRPRRPPPRRPRAEAPTAPRRRLDVELVRRRLAATLAEAVEAVERGAVTVAGAPAANPSRLVGPGESIQLAGEGPRFVSRGGEKLAAALARFDLDVTGRRVIDAGASTGGFTDCVLQHGAASVVAVDVGRAQLHQRVRADPRVTVLERTNVRHAGPDQLGPPADLVVADLSFISLITVAPALLAATAPGGDLVLLVKPQFEATRREVSAGRGVIADPEIWDRVLRDVSGTLEGLRAAIMGAMTSPLRGADGNVEFLLHAVAPGPAIDPGSGSAPLIVRAVAEATAMVTP